MPLLMLPPEILEHIASFASTPCLASLSCTSSALRDVILPILYSHLDCQSLTGALRLFRAFTNAKDRKLYIHQYARDVKAISLPTRQASREVKASIAFSLARAISEGYFPNLQRLCWTFSHKRDHSYESDRNARIFDEPLWRALDERYTSFERLEIDRADYQMPDSAAASKIALALYAEMQAIYRASWAPKQRERARWRSGCFPSRLDVGRGRNFMCDQDVLLY